MNRRTALVVACLPLVLAPVAGCGSSSARPEATHVMPDGQTMSGSSMPGSGGMEQQSGTAGSSTGEAGPSQAAAMVCSDEIRDAVAHTLQLDHAPRGLRSWGHELFRCSYLLDAGELRLSVKDLDGARAGGMYFDDLRARLPLSTSLRGVEGLGLPSFETPEGDVAFLKDHKTLWVDAGRLSRAGLPAGMSRTDVAYGVAAAVVACWSE